MGLVFNMNAMSRSTGYSLLEVMIVVSIIVLLSTFAIPSINHWQADNKFRNALQAVSELVKATRLQALATGAEKHLVVNGKSEECIAISTNASCYCSVSSLPNSPTSASKQCTSDNEIRPVLLRDKHIDITTSSGDNKVITFNKHGTLNFSSSTTIVLKSKQREGRIIISSLGRARSCSSPFLSGVAKCT